MDSDRPHLGPHVYVNGRCWYCPAVDPNAEKRFEFRRSAVATFGWTLTPRDFATIGRQTELAKPPGSRTARVPGQEALIK